MHPIAEDTPDTFSSSAEPAVEKPQNRKILIVEDEGLIAQDISRRLERAGFSVAGIAESGQEALRKVSESKPDLILMDIKIKGDLDGIQTSAKVREKFDVPIIFLTAFSDRETLDRAKITEPFGYLSKPLQQPSLLASIEVAMYRHRIERELRRERALFNTVLRSMGEAVIVANEKQEIQFLNPTAEQLTGWTAAEARNQKLLTVLEIFDQNLAPLKQEILFALIMEDAPSALPWGLTAMSRSGHAFVLEGEIAPSLDNDEMFGMVINFRDATSRRKEEQVVRHASKMDAVGRLSTGIAQDFDHILAEIQGHAERELSKEALDPGSRDSWENVLKTIDAGHRKTKQLIMSGYVWTA